MRRLGPILILAALLVALGIRTCARRSLPRAGSEGIQFLLAPGDGPVSGERALKAVRAALAGAPLPSGMVLAFAPEPSGFPSVSTRTHRLEVRGAPGELLGLRLRSGTGEVRVSAAGGADRLLCTFEAPLVGLSRHTLEVETPRGTLLPWTFEVAGPLTLTPPGP